MLSISNMGLGSWNIRKAGKQDLAVRTAWCSHGAASSQCCSGSRHAAFSILRSVHVASTRSYVEVLTAGAPISAAAGRTECKISDIEQEFDNMHHPVEQCVSSVPSGYNAGQAIRRNIVSLQYDARLHCARCILASGKTEACPESVFSTLRQSASVIQACAMHHGP